MSYPLRIWTGLLDDYKHREAMGMAVWLYLWLIARVTKEEQGMGMVLGGKFLKINEICEELNLPERTIRRWLSRLAKMAYIETVATRFGLSICVNKSKKFQWKYVTTGADSMPEMAETNKDIIIDKIRYREKGSTLKQHSPSVRPTLETITAYVKEKGYNVDPKMFFEYFTESGWVDSRGNKVKNWKQKIITWHNHSKKEEPIRKIVDKKGWSE